jgi:primosomal protein N' (replication factor Y)
MIKSPMPHYFDILFPVNLGPLTYRCPDILAPKAQPGMIVTAPLKSKITKGVLLRESSSPPPGRIRELSEISSDSPVLSRGMLKLLMWMADYYLAPAGVVLKYTVPAEIFSRTNPRRKRGETGKEPRGVIADIPPSDISRVMESLSARRYRTFLIHAPSSRYEYAAASLILGSAGNTVVLVPEVAHAEFFYGALRSPLRERACILHGEMPKGRRGENMEGIVSGHYNIVIGTRPALFAPLKDISLLLVLHEHSDSYKLDEGFRYHLRDVAVMRGFLERCTVVLSSSTPSVNSYFNALSKKYTLVCPESREKRPRIRTVDMRFEKKAGRNISKTVFDAAAKHVREGKKIMFVVNRRGYSTLILCSECGHAEECSRCRIPLVMHNKKRVLKCRYCGQERNVPDRCGKCGSFKLELLGSGAERVQEDIENLLGVPVCRFDSDAVRRRSQISEIRARLAEEGTKVLVGTKMMTRHLGISETFSMAAVLGGDAAMNLPDFRADERAFRELSSIRELVEPGGELIIQTGFPEKALFRRFKEGDYLTFVKEELALRKALHYPPYRKLLQIRLRGPKEVADRIVKTLSAAAGPVEVMGPAVVKNKKGIDEFSFLLRAEDRNLLKDAAQAAIRSCGSSKGTKIFIDVDF